MKHLIDCTVTYGPAHHRIIQQARAMFRNNREQWDLMARKLWRLPPSRSHLLMADAVLARVLRTDKLSGGRHYIDPKGQFTLAA